MRIAFVSRELHPFGGGGIGVQVAGACAALAPHAEVTVVTSSRHRAAHQRLEAAGVRSVPEGVRLAFADEPEEHEIGSYHGRFHLYSARVWEVLRSLYPDRGPDLIEFPDFLAEGLVTIQARRAHDPILRDTQVCVRLHTSAEICSVLNGHVDDSFQMRMAVAAERYSLAHADCLVAPGGGVRDAYERFYGDGAGTLARSTEVSPIVSAQQWDAPVPPPPGDEVRFLFLGRFERRKGPQQLVRAFTGLRRDGWRLTMVGGDTDTGPLGASMRATLEVEVGEEPRIELVDELPRDRLVELIDRHHVVVVPSLWECWPSVAIEALARNRPVLATPVGGLPEMLQPDGAGWLTAGTGSEQLATAVESLLDDRRAITEAIAGEGPLRAARELCDPAEFLSRYRALATPAPAPTPGGSRPRPSAAVTPLVSVVIPYFGLDRFVEDAVRSVFEQDYERIEVVVVNDGSWRPEDAVLDELTDRFPIRVLAQRNSGTSRARNAGIVHSRGRYVLPLDADNMLRPAFVSRCVTVLEAESDAAFATTWSQSIAEDGRPLAAPDQGIQPFGNSDSVVLHDNVAGDGTAVIRREMFERGFRYCPDLASYEDWQLYRELHHAGLFGVVIPERLFLNRVRSDSMGREVGIVHHGRLLSEMQAHLRAREVEWQAEVSTPTFG
jgi:glycogen synthase